MILNVSRFPPNPITFIGNRAEQFVVGVIHPLTFDQIRIHVQWMFYDDRLIHGIKQSHSIIQLCESLMQHIGHHDKRDTVSLQGQPTVLLDPIDGLGESLQNELVLILPSPVKIGVLAKSAFVW